MLIPQDPISQTGNGAVAIRVHFFKLSQNQCCNHQTLAVLPALSLWELAECGYALQHVLKASVHGEVREKLVEVADSSVRPVLGDTCHVTSCGCKDGIHQRRAVSSTSRNMALKVALRIAKIKLFPVVHNKCFN